MPMHVYLCPKGHEFEKFESINDITPKKCPECGRKAKIGAGLTGAPILKQGVGGFYKPTKEDS